MRELRSVSQPAVLNIVKMISFSCSFARSVSAYQMATAALNMLKVLAG